MCEKATIGPFPLYQESDFLLCKKVSLDWNFLEAIAGRKDYGTRILNEKFFLLHRTRNFIEKFDFIKVEKNRKHVFPP